MIGVIATAGATTATTNLMNKAVDSLIHMLHEKDEKITIKSGAAFEMYLYNAYDALNWKRTLASGDESLCIIGENNMYVDIGAYYRTPDGKKHDVDTSNVKTILSANDREDKIIVDGTGGAGKSMLMRYLFVDTVFRNAGDYVPVYMELSKIKVNSTHEIDIRAFVRQSMDNYGKISLSDDVFDYSLEQGGYVFLFDGFDEVKEDDADDVLDALQKFSAKYSNNAFIISSRERLRLRSLSSFHIIHAKELSEEKAIKLAQKFPSDSKIIKDKFCKNLKDSWFQTHREFAKNPLLLTMMFITFRQNGDISNCLPDFYQDCFDALYNKHDAVHKVGFKRTFHCDISKREFQAVFSYFCFHTWRKEIYDFSEDEILNWLEKSLKKQNLSVSAEDYLKDLTESLCIITCEGHRYRFAHRSFQTYFAAKYTCNLPDQKQKEFLIDNFNLDSIYWDNNYLNLLNQVEHERFLNNFIKLTFQDFISKYHSEQIFFQHILSYSDVEIFSTPTSQLIIPESKYNSSEQIRSQLFSYFDIEVASIPTKIIYFLTKELPLLDYEDLLAYINCKIADDFSSVEKLHSMLLRKYSEIDLTTLQNGISLRDLLHSDIVCEKDKHILSNLYLDALQAHEIYQAITDWLAEREAARQKPSSDDKFADY